MSGKHKQLVIALIAFVMCAAASISAPAYASNGGGSVPGKPPTRQGAVVPNTITCNESSCNGKDPYLTGRSAIAYKLGGDPTGMNVYFAPSPCDSNFGYTVAPSGYVVVQVQIARRNATTHVVDQVYTYCSRFDPGCPGTNPSNATIPDNATAWETDLVYAPTEQVQVITHYGVYQSSQIKGSIFSIWH